EPLSVADVMSSAGAAPAADVKSPDNAVAPEASAWQAYLKLARADERGVPVMADGRLVGLVSRRDLHHALTERPGPDVSDRAPSGSSSRPSRWRRCCSVWPGAARCSSNAASPRWRPAASRRAASRTTR